MKVIAGAVFILAAAVLVGAALIADAVRSDYNRPFGCAAVAAGAILALFGLGAMNAGLAKAPNKTGAGAGKQLGYFFRGLGSFFAPKKTEGARESNRQTIVTDKEDR